VTRARHLRALAAREADAWWDVASLVASRRLAAYDQAVVLFQDLREICDTTERSSRFTRFGDEPRQRHRAKVSLP
jgi:hypothetical protein